MQNLEKKQRRYKSIYLQNRKRLTDTEKKLMVTKGERGSDKLGGSHYHIYTTIYKTENQQKPTV